MTDLAPLFRRLGSEDASDSFQEIVLLSERKVHVVQRVRTAPPRAVIAMSPDPKKLALMLSGVHAHRQRLEART